MVSWPLRDSRMKRDANIVLYRGSPQPQDLDRWEGRMRRWGGCECSVESGGGAVILSHQIGPDWARMVETANMGGDGDEGFE